MTLFPQEPTMEQADLEQYIITHYHDLLTMEEKLAYKHHLATEKAEYSKGKLGEMVMSRWGITNQNALELLEGGFDEFKKRVANRILDEKPDKVFINNCPQCGKLARTPKAKQCRFCGYDWH